MSLDPKKLLDSDGDDVIVVAGDDFEIVFTLTKDGSTFNITSATVTCTVKQENRRENIFEDHAVAITTGASGIATMTVLDTESALLGKPKVGNWHDTILHIADVKVVESGGNIIHQELFSFQVRRPIT